MFLATKSYYTQHKEVKVSGEENFQVTMLSSGQGNRAEIQEWCGSFLMWIILDVDKNKFFQIYFEKSQRYKSQENGHRCLNQD